MSEGKRMEKHVSIMDAVGGLKDELNKLRALVNKIDGSPPHAVEGKELTSERPMPSLAEFLIGESDRINSIKDELKDLTEHLEEILF